ncbi:MAG: Fic family protein [Candidatus Latescibacteria bacterium]|nr:Fic family protein [Candidatus Latescibacterota bacterium]
MKTLQKFTAKLEQVPAPTAWYLGDLGEARGRQELFTRQSPQRLKVLREHALIESAISSNRIEGVQVDQTRVGTVLFGKALLRDRDEEEVRGYRQALDLIHKQSADLPVSEKTVQRLHGLARGQVGDAGRYKDKDADIIERYTDGRERVRFRTIPAAQTPVFMRQLVELWEDSQRDRRMHPLIALAAFNLDFLCIHPFRDGNGRVSRLLLLLQCYHLGYEVGRYLSLERLIEQNKERYYETLEQSSQGWHQGRHDPWPYINYLLYTLKTAYREFEARVGQIGSPRGAKTGLVEGAVNNFTGEFALADVEHACPGVSRDMVRRVLRSLQKAGHVECLGRGPGARWRKKG